MKMKYQKKYSNNYILMKKLLILAIASLFLFSCNQKTQINTNENSSWSTEKTNQAIIIHEL